MALQLGKSKTPPSKPRNDEERETQKTIVEDADKTEGSRSRSRRRRHVGPPKTRGRLNSLFRQKASGPRPRVVTRLKAGEPLL